MSFFAMRPRRPVLVLLSIGLALVWVYVLDQSVYGGAYTAAGYRKVQGIAGHQSALAAEGAARRLQAMMDQPSSQHNISAKAEHGALFTSLLEVLNADQSLDRHPFLDLLQRDYPWLRPGPPMYLPWSSPTANDDKETATGIVICVGTKTFIYAAHLIGTLRNVLGSTLPIQIAYAGDDDLPQAQRAQLISLGEEIETLDLLTVFDGQDIGLNQGGFALKPFAMLASHFHRVILMDADIIFIQKPDDIFETSPGLIETGTLFWHDRAQARRPSEDRREWVLDLLGGREPSRMLSQSLFWESDLSGEMESGVVCADKGRPGVFMSLIFAAWMNTDQGGKPQLYAHSYGDKESYWIAAELMGTPYYFEPDYAGNIGFLEQDDKGRDRVCSSNVAHTDSRRRPFWFNGSIRFSKEYGGRDFTNLTHWMSGAEDWPEPCHWDYLDPGLWCYRGCTLFPLETSRYKHDLDGLLREAHRLDVQFLGGV
ncbi:MAG: hypothetical protein M1838_005472 [Thelocarpon superellum]|nr:MAG: hypothetical protein M1838_005472 [Thelocarpon superellum]